MKKQYIFGALLAFIAAGVSAQTSPTHEKYVKLGGTVEWNAAYRALDESQIGKKALYEGNDADAAENENFFISRVKPRERFIFTRTQVKESLNPNRKLLWWCPIGQADWNALPTFFFGGEVFSMWSYTDIYGDWTAPFVQVPGAFTDICHKNGVVTSPVASVPWASKVSKTNGEHGKNFSAMIDGGATKFLKYLRYYGVDGIGFNSEFTFEPLSFATELKDLLGNTFKNKDAMEWPTFHNAWYSLMTSGGSLGGGLELNSGNKDWFHYNGNPTSNAYFMNYGYSSSTLSTSQSTARSFAGRSSFDVYAGMDFEGRNYANWPDLVGYDISVGLWGSHNMNMNYLNRGENGSAPSQLQKTYQLISENVFTGSSYNPVNTPAISTLLAHSSNTTNFHGFSSFITARSSLTCADLAKDPFVTYFNLGNGNFFNIEGETTFNGEWYNIGMQDYMPTWRWWWTNGFMGKNAADASKDLTAEFTWNDAWFGGSCLQISGATKAAYLQLFKTKYKTAVSGDYITIRYKVLYGTGSIAWACSTEDAPTTEVSATIKNNASSDTEGWQEVRTPINSGRNGLKVHNATLALIGLKFTNTSPDFEILIGEMSVVRGTSPTPSAPVITKSKTLARNYKGVDLKIIFKMNYTPSSAEVPVYNSDVNTWYYKVYTQQKGSDQVMCTATTSWASYVVGAPYDVTKGGQVRIGVSAVSLDGKGESPVSWGDWLDVPAASIVEGFTVDKPVIKSGEDFTVSFDDPNHSEALWEIKSSSNDALKYSITAHHFTTSIIEEGIYDLYLTQNGKTEIHRGVIQISPDEVGAMPEIKTLTGNGGESVNSEVNKEIKFEYTGRPDTEGNVSRGLRLSEKAFAVPGAQLGFTDRTPFTLCFWFYVSQFNHDTDGTQLLNIRSNATGWPDSDWGYIWSTISKTGEFGLSIRQKVNSGTAISFPSFAFKVATWYHVALVIDYTSGRQVSLYINGKLIGKSEVIAPSNIYAWLQTNYIMIGGKAFSRAGLDGYLDEFQLYNKALTAAEIPASMQHQTTIPESLIGYWDFETEPQSNNTILSTGTNKSLVCGMHNYGSDIAIAHDITFAPGTPFISGDKYKITTVPSWTYKGATTVTSEGDGESGSSDVFYQKPGTYSATLTLENGWGKSDKTINFIEIDPTGIEDMTLDEMMAFPNPFVDDVYVRFTDEGAYKVEIFDNAGRLINSSGISVAAGEMVNIPVNGGSGIYFIKVRNSDSLLKVMKVVKR